MYETGDIILVEGRGFFAFITKIGNFWARLLKMNDSIRYTHVGVMVSPSNIAEALSSGVTIRPMPYTKSFKIYRKAVLTTAEQGKIIDYALDHEGEKYSWFLLISLGILKILHLEWLFKGIGRRGVICSVFVGECFDTFNYKFNGEAVDVLDPADIADHVMYSRRWLEIN